MIAPLIDYGNIIYAGTSITNLDKLQSLQNRGLQICTNENQYSGWSHDVEINPVHKFSLSYYLGTDRKFGPDWDYKGLTGFIPLCDVGERGMGGGGGVGE